MSRSNPVLLVGLASLLALVAACTSSSSNVLSPSSTSGTQTANSDGSKLKATAPTPTSPANNTTLADGVNAPTLSATAGASEFESTGALTQRFQVLQGSTVVADLTATPSGSTVAVTTPALDYSTTYSWRVRAELNGVAGPWSSSQTFTTGKVVQPRRRAEDYGGKIPAKVAIGDLQTYLYDVGAAHPGAVQASCLGNGTFPERNSLDFPIELLMVLREKADNRWGFNCRRGNCNDPSNKIVDYHYAPGPSEGSDKVYVFQVVAGSCALEIVDQTAVTFASTTASWSLLSGSPFLMGAQIKPNLTDY